MKEYHLSIIIEIRSGKEATVYYTRDEKREYALKVYKDPERRAFQKDQPYLDGKFYAAPSVRRAVIKGNKASKKMLPPLWIKREFDILRKLQSLDVFTPIVYDWTPGSILMEFIGEDATPAPRLIDIQIPEDTVEETFDLVVQSIQAFYKIGIVHSDLSPYNILWHQQKPYIIDFPQAIDIRQNPNVKELLKRDVDNVIKYFGKYMDIQKDSIYKLFDLI